MDDNSLEEYLTTIVDGLVDDPGAVAISKRSDEMGVLLTLTVAKMDMGKVIGRGGTIAQSMRILLRAYGFKKKARVNLKINDYDDNGKLLN